MMPQKMPQKKRPTMLRKKQPTMQPKKRLTKLRRKLQKKRLTTQRWKRNCCRQTLLAPDRNYRHRRNRRERLLPIGLSLNQGKTLASAASWLVQSSYHLSRIFFSLHRHAPKANDCHCRKNIDFIDFCVFVYSHNFQPTVNHYILLLHSLRRPTEPNVEAEQPMPGAHPFRIGRRSNKIPSQT
ncbi:MAG: hypothetical protein JWN23_1427 [Rhodocyclales bacterium]|nr:hypothetical protein [Rhodocyclales bacterium]